MKDKVSIIIPCYNAGKYISAAIESCLKQTHHNIEIIVINDGSTDNSITEISLFQDKIIVHNQENKGGSAARNTGLRIASGSYIKFLDADDTLERDAIEKQVSHFVDFMKYDKVALYGDYNIIDERGDFRRLIKQPILDTDIKGLGSLIGSALITGSLLYSIEDLKMVSGFNESLKSGQEYDLNIRLFLAGVKFLHHNDIVFNHRNFYSATRISCRRWPEKEPFFIWNLMDQYEKMISTDYLRAFEIKSALAAKLASAGKSLAHAGNIDLALMHFSRAYETCPQTRGFLRKKHWSTRWYINLCRIFGVNVSERIYRIISELKHYLTKKLAFLNKA